MALAPLAMAAMALTRPSSSPTWLRIVAGRLHRAPLEAPAGTAPVLIEAPVPVQQGDPQVGTGKLSETWNILEHSDSIVFFFFCLLGSILFLIGQDMVERNYTTQVYVYSVQFINSFLFAR